MLSGYKLQIYNKKIMHVFILTFCRNLDLFYGTELIFRTLRVGFPNANVIVADNASLPEARVEIELLARKNDCFFRPIASPGIKHHDFIQNTIRSIAADKNAQGPLVFLDPDICLWDCCENFSFLGLIAGKPVAEFNCPVTHTSPMPRLHTSFLWIPDAGQLMNEIRKLKIRHFDFEPFLPYSCVINGIWYRFDTGASLYAAIPDKVSYFNEEHFNCYDHIFCGSHLDWIYPSYDTRLKKMMSEIHNNARFGHLQALKGIWKNQDEVWLTSFPVRL